MGENKTRVYVFHYEEDKARMDIETTTIGWRDFANRCKGTQEVMRINNNCLISCSRAALVKIAREMKEEWIRNAENRLDHIRVLEVK